MFSEVAKDWIAYKKPNLRETTWEVYQGHVKNHFHDLASVRINQITTAMVERFIRTRQEQGLHILTLRKILVTLGQIFNYAVRHKYIEYNPVREAERPRGQGRKAEGKGKITILTPEKINSPLDEVTDQKHRMLFMLAIFSGARQGGSYWDLNGRMLIGRIVRYISNALSTRGGFSPPKPRAQIARLTWDPLF